MRTRCATLPTAAVGADEVVAQWPQREARSIDVGACASALGARP
ncbi:MAG: hypothetical protein AB7S26_28570 [Sandaracinaceae bacterium]